MSKVEASLPGGGQSARSTYRGAHTIRTVSVLLKDTSTNKDYWTWTSSQKNYLFFHCKPQQGEKNKRKYWLVRPQWKDEVCIDKKKNSPSLVWVHTSHFILAFMLYFKVQRKNKKISRFMSLTEQWTNLFFRFTRLLCFQIIILFRLFLFIKTCPWSHIADGAL